jgi:transcriptional regulator with XRE-family HTH domain
MFSAPQLKAARALAGWSREELAERAGVAAETIKRFELRGSDPKVSTLLKLRRALAFVGIEFTDAADGKGEGVRFKTDSRGAPLAKKRTPASTKLPRSKQLT